MFNGSSAFAIPTSSERPADSFKTAFFSETKPGFLKALELMNKCAKIAGIAKCDLGRIHAQTGKTRP
jgi:hypothetical protein